MSATDSQPAKAPLLSTITRWVLIVHAALIIAQPFVAGAMLDGSSPAAHAWHLNIGMFLTTFGFVQVVITAIAWKWAGWPQNAFSGSIAIWFLEIAQFFIGYLGMPLAMHIPLGILLVIASLVMVYLYARRTPLPDPEPSP